MPWKPLSRDYSPGGLTSQAAKRAAARRGGYASGRRRRQLAHARRGRTVTAGQLSAPLEYELRPPDRARFDSDYAAAFPRPERPCAAAAWERGREAVWGELIGSWRLLCACGQHSRSTNGQRAAALSSRGLPRGRRSIQLYHRKLERLGYAGYLHVRKPAGQKDCLSIEWRLTRQLRSSFSPPLRERRTAPTGHCSPPCSQRLKTSIPPASRADEIPPDEPAERLGTEQGQIAAQIRFAELKLRLGWGPVGELRRRIRELEAQASSLEASAQASEPGSHG